MSATKIILWVLFISCPSILLAGFVVYKINEKLHDSGVYIDQNVYLIVLFISMWLAMLLSSKKIFIIVFRRDETNETKANQKK